MEEKIELKQIANNVQSSLTELVSDIYNNDFATAKNISELPTGDIASYFADVVELSKERDESLNEFYSSKDSLEPLDFLKSYVALTMKHSGEFLGLMNSYSGGIKATIDNYMY